MVWWIPVRIPQALASFMGFQRGAFLNSPRLCCAKICSYSVRRICRWGGKVCHLEGWFQETSCYIPAPPKTDRFRAWKLMVGRRFLPFHFQGQTASFRVPDSGEGQPHPNWWSMEEKMEESWTWDGVRAITITQTGAGLSGRFGDCQINFFGGTPSAGAQAPQRKTVEGLQKKASEPQRSLEEMWILSAFLAYPVVVLEVAFFFLADWHMY